MSKELIRRFAIDTDLEIRSEEDGTIEASLSSEYPVDRPGYGQEVLVHTADAVDLSRAPLPLITSHDHSQTPVGVVEQIRIIGNKLRGLIRLGKSKRARELLEDIKGGILKNLSIGYQVIEAERDGETYRVTKWAPYEASLVSVPADPTVGIGRSEPLSLATKRKGNITMEKRDMENEERRRSSQILALGQAHNDAEGAIKAVSEGMTLNKYRGRLLSKIEERPAPETGAVLGMNKHEINGFSFMRAIEAQLTGDWRKAGLEREAINAAADLLGRTSENIIIPPDLMRRDLTKSGTSSATIQTDVLDGSFIDILRNASLMLDRVTFLDGLVGDAALPRLSGSSTAYWVAEGSNVTESTPTMDQLSLSPSTVGGLVDISRKMMLQSTPAAEDLVRHDLAATLATEIDRAIINGSGSGAEPTGILGTSGIGDVAGGTNGAAPTWTHLMGLIEDVAVGNADNADGVFVTNAKVESKLRQTAKVSSTDSVMCLEDSTIAGREVLVTNQVPSNLTKGTSSGVCSAVIYADLSQVVLGSWGSLELAVDQNTHFASGAIRVRALWDVDFGLRHTAAFSAMQDALTA